MSTYILVHGAWHGSWCWDKFAPFLRDTGHKVETPDLPSHGADRTPVSEITLQAYTDRVCEVIDAQIEPVILVGHSMSGMVITQTAEYRSEKIKTLVYLSAFLPQNGQNLLQLSEPDTKALVLPNLVISEDQSYALLKDEVIEEAFYEDCSDEDVQRARSLLTPQALAPLATPVSTSTERFGSVPRVYVACLRDKAITPECQAKMYNTLRCEKVLFMDTSHSPFFSAPRELAGHLLSL